MITCGTQVVSGSTGGGASLPATPSAALLDAGAPSTMLGLNSSGVGEALSAAAARSRMALGTLATQNGTFSGTSSGTNTGDQTITLSGDASGSGTGAIAVTVTDLTIASEARGDLLRRGATVWQRVSANTLGNVVAGDGTDVVSQTIATTLAVAASANRTALGLGGAAVLSVGTTTGTVAAGDDSRITGAIQSSLLTTRGDIITRGASAPQRLALGTSTYVLTSDGTDAVWAAPTSGATQTINWTTGTATSGNGTATITSATVVTLSMASGATASYASGTYTAPRVRLPMPSGVIKTGFRVTLRLASFTNKTTTTTPCITLESTGAASAKYGLYFADTTVGSQNFVSAAGITSGIPATAIGYDGNDWVQLVVERGTLMFSFGRGTGGARPANTAFRSCGAIFAFAPFDTLGWDLVVLMAQSTGAPSTVTMTYDSCTVETL